MESSKENAGGLDLGGRGPGTGVALLAAAIFVHPWAMGPLFAPDGSVDGEGKIFVLGFLSVCSALAGLIVLAPPVRAWITPLLSTLPRVGAAIVLTSITVNSIVWGVNAYNSAHHHTMDLNAMGAPTAEQRKWARDFVNECRETALANGWYDIEKAKADGFGPMWKDLEHYPNPEFLFDDVILDANKPEFLMYSDTPEGKLLVGYMFYARTLDEKGPQPGGSLTSWHYHPWGPEGRCAVNDLLPVGRPDENGECAEGNLVMKSPEMMHVWLLDHRLGPFAHNMLFPDTEAGFDLTNVHPIFVHFTVALFTIALLLDVLGVAARRESFHSAAWINLVLAAIFGVGTVVFGLVAETQVMIDHEDHMTLTRHKQIGFAVLAVIFVLVFWRLRTRGAFPGKAALAATTLGVGLMWVGAHYGGQLVYGEGIAVKAVDRNPFELHKRWVFDEVLGRDGTAPPAMDHQGMKH
jgi:uncharacterized membrane protein